MMETKHTSDIGRFNFFLIGINVLILLEHYLGRQLYPVNTPGKELSWLFLPAILAISLLLNIFTVKLITASGGSRICLREPFTLKSNAKSIYLIISIVNILIGGMTVFCMIDAGKFLILAVPILKVIFILVSLCYLPKLLK